MSKNSDLGGAILSGPEKRRKYREWPVFSDLELYDTSRKPMPSLAVLNL